MEERYIKNIDEVFTEKLQRTLFNTTIAVVGCGGQGGYVIEYLARLGVKVLIIWDGDYFEKSNLNRQIGCTLTTLGKNKAEVMKDRIKSINPNLLVYWYDHYFGDFSSDIDKICQADFIINCADPFYNGAKIREIYRNIILMGIPVLECPGGITGGFVAIETADSIEHFDYQTQIIINAPKDKTLYSQPAYKCAMLAAEAVNQMVQYFNKSRFASIGSVLEIDMLHHRYKEHDKYGVF